MLVENEQYGNKQSFYHLEVCCRLVGEKFGNPTISSWTNRDYIKLSSILSRETEVQISPSTLKRIFGKLKTPERYFPQKATRDALARFSGFKDWETLVRNHPKATVTEEVQVTKEENGINIAVPKPAPSKKTRKVYLIIGAMAAILFTWKFILQAEHAPVRLDGIRLVCSNPEGENPHSANFHFELPKDFGGDLSNFTVDFGDARREKKIIPGKLVTHFYEIPGRYYAVLKYGGQPLDTVSLYLKTYGWTATATMEKDTTRVYPINSNWLFKKTSLQVDALNVLRSGVDTTRTFFVHFVNSKPLDINGDNFELETNVVTSQLRPGVRCSQVVIEAFGEKSEHSVMLIKPGCVSWAYLRFSEIHKNGETEDLSTLGADLTQGGTVALRVENKKVSLFINHKLTFNIDYTVPLKKLYGLKVSFSGIGTINYLRLKDLTTGKIFNEGFSR